MMNEHFLLCENCGQKIADKINFCPFCGTKITTASRPFVAPISVSAATDPWEKESRSSVSEENLQKNRIPSYTEVDAASRSGEATVYKNTPDPGMFESSAGYEPSFREAPSAAKLGYGHPKKRSGKFWLLLIIPIVAVAAAVALILGFFSSVKEDLSSDLDSSWDSGLWEDAFEEDFLPEWDENTENALDDWYDHWGNEESTDVFPGEQTDAFGSQTLDFSAQFSDMVLYSNNDITILINASEVSSSPYSIDFPVTITNHSDAAICVMQDCLSVNGYSVASYFYSEISPGKTDETVVSLYPYDLECCGIEDLAEIDFQFEILNNTTYEYIDIPDTPTLQSSLYGTWEQAYDTSGHGVYADGKISIVLQDIYPSDYGSSVLVFYTENHTEETLIVSSDAFSVNDTMVNSFLYQEILPGSRAVYEVDVYDSELPDNHTIEHFALSLVAYNSNTFATVLETDLIEVAIPSDF